MNKEKKEELDRKWKAVATKAVTDDEFKKKLVKDPMTVLEVEGLKVSEGVTMNLGTDKVHHFKVAPDASDDLKDEARWWTWRLNSIREFGRETVTGPTAMIMDAGDDDV